ncbi:60S acidic ribosomal protein P3-2 [Senna tora]|uniref:60S acidic ribosomal protein P3-2 n=1 Tax=Senna tora TaxID=362788 RepID=A0A834SMS7_9FABA|nr:60S acidic ribosomal protein P3-2 [Senna tora]
MKNSRFGGNVRERGLNGTGGIDGEGGLNKLPLDLEGRGSGGLDVTFVLLGGPFAAGVVKDECENSHGFSKYHLTRPFVKEYFTRINNNHIYKLQLGMTQSQRNPVNKFTHIKTTTPYIVNTTKKQACSYWSPCNSRHVAYQKKVIKESEVLPGACQSEKKEQSTLYCQIHPENLQSAKEKEMGGKDTSYDS